MGIPIKILLVEDSEDDALFEIRELRRCGYAPQYERVDHADAMLNALKRTQWDLILSDYNLPHFSGPQALEIYHIQNLNIPFIVVSGVIGEDAAVSMMKSGAHDYIMKDNLKRLAPAIQREMKEAASRRERQAMEELLQVSKFTLDHSPNSIIWLDPEGTISFINETGCQNIKSDFQFILNRKIWEFDPGFSENCWKEFWHSIQVQKKKITESVFIGTDGQTRIIENTYLNLSFGEKQFIVMEGRDITERKRAEEALLEQEEMLHQFFNMSPIGIVMSDLKGHLIQVNQAFCTTLGYSMEELLQKTYIDISYPDPDELAANQALRDQLLNNGGNDIQMEKRYLTRDGRIIYSLLHLTLVKNFQDMPQYYIAQIVDIGDRKHAEKNLHYRDNLLEVVSRSAEVFLKNPDLNENLPLVLERMGKAAGVHRVKIYRMTVQKGNSYIAQQIHIWAAKGIPSFSGDPDLLNFNILEKGFQRWSDTLSHNKIIRGNISDFPLEEQPELNRLGIVSTLVVPIFVDNTYWGFIGIDDCVSQRFWSDMEVEIFRLIASLTGDAILRQWAHEALQSSEKRFRSVFEQAALGISFCDLNGKFILVNRKLTEITGYQQSELEEMSFHDISHLEDVFLNESDIKRALENGTNTYSLEKRYICKDGSIIWVQLTISLICDPSGIPEYFIGISDDITIRKRIELTLRESEEHLRMAMELILRTKNEWEATFDAVNDMIFITDAKGGVIRYNHSVNKYFNTQSNALLDRSIAELFIGKSAKVVDFASLQGEIQFPCLEGTFEIYSYPLNLDDMKVQRVYVIKDITLRKQIEHSMLASMRLADLGAMAAGVMHDIRSPLQTITGLSDSLINAARRGTLPTDTLTRKLGMINQSGWRIDQVMRSILSFSRTPAAQSKMEDINSVVKDTLQLIEHQLAVWANISVKTELSDELPLLSCNKTHISQALINLITNARDAMPTGGTLTIHTEYNASSDEILLSVADTGIGIAPELQEKIFEAFFTTKSPEAGTGLGLSNVHNVVRTHGGHIHLESSPGCGANFLLYFPLHPEEKETEV